MICHCLALTFICLAFFCPCTKPLPTAYCRVVWYCRRERRVLPPTLTGSGIGVAGLTSLLPSKILSQYLLQQYLKVAVNAFSMQAPDSLKTRSYSLAKQPLYETHHKQSFSLQRETGGQSTIPLLCQTSMCKQPKRWADFPHHHKFHLILIPIIYRDWKFKHPKRKTYSIRHAKVGKNSLFSKEVLYTLFITNVISLLLGAGVG